MLLFLFKFFVKRPCSQIRIHSFRIWICNSERKSSVDWWLVTSYYLVPAGDYGGRGGWLHLLGAGPLQAVQALWAQVPVGQGFIPYIFIAKKAPNLFLYWIGLDPASDPPSANVWIRIRIKRCRSEAFLVLHCIKRPDVSQFGFLESCFGPKTPKSGRDSLTSVADPDPGSGMTSRIIIPRAWKETIFWVKNTLILCGSGSGFF